MKSRACMDVKISIWTYWNRRRQLCVHVSSQKRRDNAPRTFAAGVNGNNAADANSSDTSIRSAERKSQEKFSMIEEAEGTAFALPDMANAEPNTVGAFTNDSQSLGGSAPAISSASEPSIRSSDRKSQEKFSAAEAAVQHIRPVQSSSPGKRRSIAFSAADCSARFLLLPVPLPTGFPLSSTSTSKCLSWSGPDSPISS